MMLERQSTTVPNTSNANARGAITVPARPSRALRRQPGSPAPPAPSDSGYRTGGGGLRPASTSFADSEPEHRLRARIAVDELAASDADHADVAQQQPVDLDRRNPAGREPDHQQPPFGGQRADRVVERLAADRVHHQSTPRPSVCVAHRLQPSRRSAAAPRRRPATETKSVASGAVHHRDDAWRPSPWRSVSPRCRRRRRSRAPAPSRPAAARRGAPARSTSCSSCPAAHTAAASSRSSGVGNTGSGGTATRSANPPSMRERRHPLARLEAGIRRAPTHHAGDLHARDERRLQPAADTRRASAAGRESTRRPRRRR